MKTAFVLLSLCLPSLSGCSRSTPPVTAEQVVVFIEEGRKSFSLSDLDGLPDWESAYVFGPYTDDAQILDCIDLDWPGVTRFDLMTREDIHLVVFKARVEAEHTDDLRRVAHAEAWLRARFDVHPDLLLRELTPGSVFQLDRRDDGMPLLRP